MTTRQPDNADIELVEQSGEITLLINGGQAMQAWETDLMQESADILCSFGSTFLEVGLGLGISALRIAGHLHTRKHTVIEKYQEVIDIFLQRHPAPPTLELVRADFFDYVYRLEPGRLDGIFFDPYLPPAVEHDQTLWVETVPLIVRSLRIGGAFMPCFSTKPSLRWQFVQFFDRAIVERRTFMAYPTTEYTPGPTGDAYIQYFIRCR
jgi:hypothetical protein